MASSTTKRLGIVGALAVLSLAAARFIIAPSSVTIIAPVLAGDTAGHVDLRVARSAQLQAVALDIRGDTMTERAKWTSGNTRVATVSSTGSVLAKGRGYATITATVGGISARVRVCVTSTGRESLAWSIAQTRTTLANERLYVGQTSLATAHVALKIGGATAWGECVHWRVDSAARAFASIDRAGVLHTSRSVSNVVAAVGPELPR